MKYQNDLERVLGKLRDVSKGEILSRFFKTGSGQYGEGDVFWGIPVPAVREVAKRQAGLPLPDLLVSLSHPVHEIRMAALFAMIAKYRASDAKGKIAISKAYLKNTRHINNWDLVDLSCYHILGDYLWHNPDKQPVFLRLASSSSLWEKRIAIVSTMAFIRQGSLDWTYRLAELFLSETHDLMHKATGWMLREAGKRDEKRLKDFLDRFGKDMPRTALRYAIERFSEKEREHYLLSTRKKDKR
jgi:3-methyladenine DNA glycosylase AlkD